MERVYSYNPKPAVGATVAERCFGTQSHKVTQLSLHSVVCRLAGCLTAQKCFKYVVYVKAWPTYIKRNLGQETGQTEPGLVALYDIWPGNEAGLLLHLWSLHVASAASGTVSTDSTNIIHDDICLKQVVWSEGRRPLGAALHSPDEPSELSQWPGHDDSTINIVLVIIIIIIQ